MILQDFQCDTCGMVFEEMVKIHSSTCFCPSCGNSSGRIYTKTPHVCVAMIPTYPGCKKQKAGYTHTHHADQNATRVQSGYGGCVGPK